MSRARRRETSLPADGLLLLDKPAGVSSHDAVAAARRVLRERRIGHLGTLDPFATGLLVLLVGRATRLARYVAGEPKVYEALVRFGRETTTDDLTGETTRMAAAPDPARVLEGMRQLTGAIDQLPPAFSAKKVGGERSYAAAREGRAVALRPAHVVVHEWQVHELDAEHARVTVRCGGGTYIRALARDLGRLAGSAAHLEALRRTASGPFDVRDALPLAEVADAGRHLRPAQDGVPQLVRRRLEPEERALVTRGGSVAAAGAGERAALLDDGDRLVAIAERLRRALAAARGAAGCLSAPQPLPRPTTSPACRRTCVGRS
jgi:tRNA pseudouridine55 synthase